MKLLKSFATVGIYTLLSRVFGFIRTMLTAYLLGAGDARDALVTAIRIPSLLRRILAEGSMSAVFVPMYGGELAKNGKDEANSLAQEILGSLVWILFFLVIIVEFFMPQVVFILAPGYVNTPERLRLAIEFTRITFPFIFFISLTAFYGGILNSIDRFAAMASSPMVGNIFIILFLGGAWLLDHNADFGKVFAYATVLCGVVQFLWVYIPAYRNGVSLKIFVPKFIFSPRLKEFLKRIPMAAAGSGVGQVNVVIGGVIASFLASGSVSYLDYAERLYQLPLSVIGTAIATALLPLLSKQIRLNDTKSAQESQEYAINLCLFLTLPATIGLMILAPEIITILFEHGKFTKYDSIETASTLRAFSFGLPAYVLIKIFATGFFARKQTRQPFIAAAVSVVVDIVLSIILMFPFAYKGIAFSTAFASWVNAGILGYLLYKRGYFIITDQLLNFLKQMSIICVLISISILVPKFYLASLLFGDDFMLQVVSILFIISLAVLVLFVAGAYTGAFDIRGFIKRRIIKT